MCNESDYFLRHLISSAFLRFNANLSAALPRTAPQLRKLLRGVPIDAEHVLNVRGFPHFVLPYWLSPLRDRTVDAEFQSDVIYSTLNGSHSIRLCDNIADNDCPPELKKCAPCAAYFDSEFIRPYMKFFGQTNDFWGMFDKFWAQQAEASSADSLLDDVDEETFASLSSTKFTATKIPIAAVECRYQNLGGSLQRWFQFVDALGNFTQFNNDFFDWNHDSLFGITTYISSESKRRAPRDSLAEWFLREGFDWGAAELKVKFDNVRLEAETLGNQEVLEWTNARGRLLDRDIVGTRSGLELVKTFGKITCGSLTKGGANA